MLSRSIFLLYNSLDCCNFVANFKNNNDHEKITCYRIVCTRYLQLQENGVSVNELQTQLLQKIEELTLYLIQQEQTIQELRQKLEQLEK